MTTEAPTDLFASGALLPVGFTPVGELLERAADAPTGAWTAVLLDGIEPTELSDRDLPAYLTVCARVQAWSAARLSDGIAEISARPEVSGAVHEVALALREPVGAAQRRIWQAHRLRRLPETRRRFRIGELSQRDAESMIEVTARINDPDLIAEVERRTLRSVAGKTAAQLRAHARRILTRLDPEGAEQRAHEARDQQTDVTFEAGEDGMAGVHAELPVEDGRIVKEAVDAYAIARKQDGDPRPIGVLRGQAVTRWASDYLVGRASSGPAPRSAGRPIEIGIVVGLPTALGRDEIPGEVAGCGLVPRDAIAAMIADEQAKLRLLVVNDSGHLVYRAADAYRPTADQIAQVRAAWVTSAGPGSQVSATRCDTDHSTPWPIGPTSVDNLVPLDRRTHVSKTRRTLSVTIDDAGSATWNTPLGQSRTVEPYDYVLKDEQPEADEEPPPF